MPPEHSTPFIQIESIRRTREKWRDKRGEKRNYVTALRDGNGAPRPFLDIDPPRWAISPGPRRFQSYTSVSFIITEFEGILRILLFRDQTSSGGNKSPSNR